MKKCYIETNNGICYNASRQNEINIPTGKNENPMSRDLMGFSIP